MTTSHKEGYPTLTWQDLQKIKFTFDSSFFLRLVKEECIFAEKVVRLIPGRRMVLFGHWKGKQIVAKLFFDSQHAKRHQQNDMAGIKVLQKHKIPTPSLYYQGTSDDKRVRVLIYERIFAAENLETIWQDKKNVVTLLPLLQAVIIELATQHVFGILQHDLHLKNFLLTNKQIYTLDGAQIELFPDRLPKKVSMNNLALFLAQLGVGVETYQEKLFHFYAKSRGWLLKQHDVEEVFFLINKWNALRWQRFATKIFRESSQFSRIRSFRYRGMYDRQYAGPELMHFLAHPDTAFQHPGAQMLKAGRSATVIKVTFDQRDFVIKRYNLKNVWHRLRRCLRATRALTSWRLAQKLCLFGIDTAKPVAFLEKRFLGLRGQAYYVTEYVSGENVGDFFLRHTDDEEKLTLMIKNVAHLLKNMTKLKLTHGDLKTSNILIDKNDKPVLIDLDGAKEHDALSALRKAWGKEVTRFLRNFPHDSWLQQTFKMELF